MNTLAISLPTDGTWTQISTDEAYFMQNSTKIVDAADSIISNVEVKASDTIPTDSNGAIILSPFDCVNSSILTGIIWAKCASTIRQQPILISVSK